MQPRVSGLGRRGQIVLVAGAGSSTTVAAARVRARAHTSALVSAFKLAVLVR